MELQIPNKVQKNWKDLRMYWDWQRYGIADTSVNSTL